MPCGVQRGEEGGPLRPRSPLRPLSQGVLGQQRAVSHFQVQLMQLTEKQSVRAAELGPPSRHALPTGLTAVSVLGPVFPVFSLGLAGDTGVGGERRPVPWRRRCRVSVSHPVPARGSPPA